MSDNEIEKRTSLWVALFILFMSLVYIFVSLGKATWINYIAIGWGLFLSIFLFLQAGIAEYFREKAYRRIGVGDIIVWLTIIVETGVFVNNLLLFSGVQNQAPTWLISFARTTGITTGVTAGVLAVVHLLFGRFK